MIITNLTEGDDMPHGIVTGNAAEANASPAKGWVVGHFMKGLAKSSGFEIKAWHYDSQPDYGQKVFQGTEFFIVEKGALRVELEIPDQDGSFVHRIVELKGSSRDYIIIPPHCKKRIWVREAPAYGVTVRWPSAPGINVVVK